MGNRGTTASLAVLACLRRLSSIPQRDQLRPLRGTGARKLTLPWQSPALASRNPRRVYATKAWWVDGKADGVYKSMIAAGATPAEAEIAVERVYQEEEQRREAEQQYLDWLHGYDPERGKALKGKQQEPSQ